MAERIFHHGIFQMPFFASVFSYNGGQYSGRLNTVSDGLFNNEKDTLMRKPARGYARVDRVKEQIMRELAELVRTGLKDPRAGFITINDVEVTRDYSHATVYYTVLDDKAREVTAEALEHAKGFLRSELSKRITVGLVTPYPPGIPLLIPGEVFNKKIVDYLKFAREFNAQCPGFETDIHGLVEEVGKDGVTRYYADCVR